MTNARPLAAGAAPGKVILFGEHAVVYGRPAVAAALTHGLGAAAEVGVDGPLLKIPRWGSHGLQVKPSRGVNGDAVSRAFGAALDWVGCDLDESVLVTVDGALPLGVGLGSSAAFGVTLLRALANYKNRAFTTAELAAGAECIERIFHGQPSGLDHTVVIEGGCVRYQRDHSPRFRRIKLHQAVPLVVGWTPREGNTKIAVEGLKQRHRALPLHYETLFNAMEAVAEAGVDALESGDLPRLGALFDLNHGYLNACGVSHPSNERMVALARANGALGAKLTGAGLGGSVIAIPDGHPDPLALAIRQAGFDVLVTELRNPPQLLE